LLLCLLPCLLPCCAELPGLEPSLEPLEVSLELHFGQVPPHGQAAFDRLLDFCLADIFVWLFVFGLGSDDVLNILCESNTVY
jgi:hypothetical protein